MADENPELATAINALNNTVDNLNSTVKVIPVTLDKLKEQLAKTLKENNTASVKQILDSNKSLSESLKNDKTSSKLATPLSAEFFAEIYKKIGVLNTEKKEDVSAKERQQKIEKEGEKVNLIGVNEPTLQKLSITLKKSFKQALQEFLDDNPDAFCCPAPQNTTPYRPPNPVKPPVPPVPPIGYPQTKKVRERVEVKDKSKALRETEQFRETATGTEQNARANEQLREQIAKVKEEVVIRDSKGSNIEVPNNAIVEVPLRTTLTELQKQITGAPQVLEVPAQRVVEVPKATPAEQPRTIAEPAARPEPQAIPNTQVQTEAVPVKRTVEVPYTFPETKSEPNTILAEQNKAVIEAAANISLQSLEPAIQAATETVTTAATKAAVEATREVVTKGAADIFRDTTETVTKATTALTNEMVTKGAVDVLRDTTGAAEIAATQRAAFEAAASATETESKNDEKPKDSSRETVPATTSESSFLDRVLNYTAQMGNVIEGAGSARGMSIQGFNAAAAAPAGGGLLDRILNYTAQMGSVIEGTGAARGMATQGINAGALVPETTVRPAEFLEDERPNSPNLPPLKPGMTAEDYYRIRNIEAVREVEDTLATGVFTGAIGGVMKAGSLIGSLFSRAPAAAKVAGAAAAVEAMPLAAQTAPPLGTAGQSPITDTGSSPGTVNEYSTAATGSTPLANVAPEQATNISQVAGGYTFKQNTNMSGLTDGLVNLSAKLDELIGTMSKPSSDNPGSVLSNVNNSKSTVTNFNNYMGAGDEINTSRNKTEQKLFNYRLQY